MIIKCPHCGSENVTYVGSNYIYDTDENEIDVPSYICNECRVDGKKTQFYLEIDKKVMFPYNQIFVNKLREEFYREPYLKTFNVGNMKI